MNPIVLVAIGAFLAQGSSASSSGVPLRTAPPRSAHHSSATAYAAAKLPMMERRWDDAVLRRAVERFAAIYLPGAPLAAVFGLGASSTGPTEDLGTAVGLWGVERAKLIAWSSDEETVRVLRRPFTLAAYPTDLEAQAYTGCRRYRDAWADVARALGALVGSAAESPAGDVSWVNPFAMGSWEMQCAAASYSSGTGALTALVRPHLDAVRAVPRATRFGGFAQLVGADCARAGAAGTVAGLPVSGLVGAAWTATRPRERYETGRALQRTRGAASDAAWFSDPGPPADVGDALSLLTHS